MVTSNDYPVKQQTIRLSLPANEKHAIVSELERIAVGMGYTYNNRPSISAMVQAIAKGHLRIEKSADGPPLE